MVHFWFAVEAKVRCWIAAPAVLLLPATSRHLVFCLLQILYWVLTSKLRHTVTTWV